MRGAIPAIRARSPTLLRDVERVLRVAAREFEPDVVLCDIGMAGTDGYETCRRRLRRLPGLENAVIAAVSGYGSEEDRRKSQEAGFDRHLVKPVDPGALLRMLAELQKVKA